MRRRDFIALVGAATASFPLAARAQQSDRTRRVGVLMIVAEGDPQGLADRQAFEKGLLALGWRADQNIHIEYRWAGGDSVRLNNFASELLGMGMDVIVTEGTPALSAARKVTQTVPIVFANVTDPVGQGFVKSLASPGGNITGFTLFEFSIGPKWVQMLREVAPSIKHLGFLFNPQMAPYSNLYFRPVQVTAEMLGIDCFPMPVEDDVEIDRSLSALAQRRNGGLIVLQDAFTATRRDFLVPKVAEYRIPAVYGVRLYAQSGGLISYGVNFADQFRQAAIYVDRIIKGTAPRDLPVQQPTKFEFVINLKAAKAMDLDVPMSLLLSADEVIE